MNPELEQLLSMIEADMAGAVGHRFVDVAGRYFHDSAEPSRPVSSRAAPAELARNLEPFPAAPGSIEEVAGMLERDVVPEANWLYHPRYMGHQVTAPLPAAVWTESVIAALNQSIAVREMSPMLTVIEKQVIDWLAGLAGLGPRAGGTFTSGGTEATFTALLAARAQVLPNAWEKGVGGDPTVVLCGEHAHYAVTRAVAQLGLGLEQVVLVKSSDFRMDAADLRSRLNDLKSAGRTVMAVVATAGSTATGSFDDLNAIADACDEHDIWLHLDGAHGASALLSKTRGQSLKGIGRARSIAWDPHKMMLMPLSAGVLLVRDEADLENAFRQRAPYLFHAQEDARSWDQGSRSFQCSRRGDVLKLWVSVHRYGTEAFGLLYDRFCDLTIELRDLLRNHGAFEVMHEPECNILCFRYVGDRNYDESDLDSLNLAIREQYNRHGTGWITTTILAGKRVLRTTLLNPRIRTQHLEELVAELAAIAVRHGEKL